jgi:CDP-diacylglycerol--serine O-phosphatidyltransferase
MSLPDYVTVLNLLSGILSIFSAIHGKFVLASVLLFAAVFFDMIDGYIARKMHLEADFGAELDSLGDLVSFGVAPMVLIMTFYNTTWLSIIALALPICGALRLARHNINRNATHGFLIGIPITMSGLIIPFVIFLDLNIYVAAVITAGLSASYLSSRRVNKLLS